MAMKTLWTNHYLCECGEHWQDQHDCCCNDRCSVCKKEIQPYISNDGSVSQEQIDAALEDALVKLGLCRCGNADCGVISRQEDLEPINDLLERVTPGDEMPDGQCPECGWLAYAVKKEEALYVVVHRHEYGSTPYLVASPHIPSCDELVAKLKIDFEPEKGEELDVMELAGQLRPIRLQEAA